MAAGAIDRIYVHSPDRLARRYAYQVLLIEEVRRAGVEIVFLNRPIGGSAEDDLLLQVQGMIAEYERAKILERSRRGRRHAARSGSVSALCAAPFGYRYVGKVAGGGMARFEVIDDEARIVRQIFAWVGLERVSLHESAAGWPRPAAARVPGWRAGPDHRLRHAEEPGLHRAGRFRALTFRATSGPPAPDPGPPLAISEGQHPHPGSSRGVDRGPCARPGRAGAVRGSAGPAGRDTGDTGGKGVGVPVGCSRAWWSAAAAATPSTARWPVARSAAARRPSTGYFRCLGTDGHRFGGVAPCTNRSVRSDCLELAVWAEIRALLEDPRRLAAEYQRRLDELQQGTARPDQAATLDRSIEGLHLGIGRLIDSYAEGVIDRDEFQPRIAGLKERLARMKEQRQALAEAAEAERSLALVIGRWRTLPPRSAAASTSWTGRPRARSSASWCAGSRSTAMRSR